MRDMENVISKLSLLYTLCKLADVDLGLSAENEELINNAAESSRFFFTQKNGELVEAQPEIIASFLEKTAESVLTEEGLQQLFDSIK
jgi:flagellar basal body-associated protein FliL